MTDSDRWSAKPDREKQQKLKTEPWVLFGLALIVSTASVLFAVGTWIIRGGQAGDAVSHFDELTAKVGEQTAEISELSETNESLQSDLTTVRSERTDAQDELRRVEAELASKDRQVTQTQESLRQARRNDQSPSTLSVADLATVIDGGATFAASAFVTADPSVSISKGALLGYLKQEVRAVCGFQFADEGDYQIIVSVVTASASSGQTAISIMLEVRDRWKVPGEEESWRVSVWRQHSAGLTQADKADSFVEELLDDMIESLKNDLS